MTQVIKLALRDMLRNRLQLICDTALLVGVLVPLMVLLGAKTGVQQAMLEDLYSDPAILEIHTRGNVAMGLPERDEVMSWPETAFVALKIRSYTDFVRVRKTDGRRIETVRLVATAPGDPLLEDAPVLGLVEFAISTSFAEQLGVGIGDTLDVASDSPDRRQQLRFQGVVVALAPPERVPDAVMFASTATLQLFEAFYEGYALPDYGISDGRDLASRVEDFEGMRIYATDLEEVPVLAQRVERFLSVQTRSEAEKIAATLRLGDNLTLAFQIIASVAVIGLIAALLSSFWAAVDRKRKTLATLALLGLPQRRLVLFPLIQAVGLTALSLVMSFCIFAVAAAVADVLFGGRFDGAGHHPHTGRCGRFDPWHTRFGPVRRHGLRSTYSTH